MSNSFGIVGNIEPEAFSEKNKTLIDVLMSEYGHAILRSVITTFGLDAFIHDSFGGDVDTIQNVRKIGSDPKLEYKNANNKANYEGREKYDKVKYHTDERYRSIVRKARDEFDANGTMVSDAYVPGNKLIPRRNDTIPRGRQAQLDHVLSAENIHNDPGRILSGLDGLELANSEDNLAFTNAALNLNMSSMNVEDYITWCEQNPEKVNYNGNKGDPLPDEVKKKLREEYEKAKEKYDVKINKAYYLDFNNPKCRQFYKDTAKAAAKRGVQMGMRQAIGFLLADVIFSVMNEVGSAEHSFEGVWCAIGQGIEKGFEKAQEDYKEILAKFFEGSISGIISSLTTTLMNVFFTTTENIQRILRQAWSSIVEATRVLFLGGKDLYLCDRVYEAAKVLAGGASMVVGISVQETVTLKISNSPIPDKLKEMISTFAGSLVSGLVSVSLLFYIDNAPIRKFFEKIYGRKYANLELLQQKYIEYCACLRVVDVETIIKEIGFVRELIHNIQDCDDQDQINRFLKDTCKKLGIDYIETAEELEEKMTDKSYIFQF